MKSSKLEPKQTKPAERVREFVSFAGLLSAYLHSRKRERKGENFNQRVQINAILLIKLVGIKRALKEAHQRQSTKIFMNKRHSSLKFAFSATSACLQMCSSLARYQTTCIELASLVSHRVKRTRKLLEGLRFELSIHVRLFFSNLMADIPDL